MNYLNLVPCHKLQKNPTYSEKKLSWLIKIQTMEEKYGKMGLLGDIKNVVVQYNHMYVALSHMGVMGVVKYQEP